MTNLEKIKKLEAGKKSTWEQEAKWRQTNEEWLSLSFDIAIRVLDILRSKGMTQKDLANKMGVSPQFINKIVKGQENLSLETIAKLSHVLGIPLIEVTAPESQKSELIKVEYVVEQAYELIEKDRQQTFANYKMQGIDGLHASMTYHTQPQLQYKQR